MKDNDINVDEADSLPQLTEKQYKFVECKLKGMSNSDSYRQAYDTKGWTQNGIWCAASKTASNTKVKQWLEWNKRQALNELLDETKYTLQAHIDELNMAIEYALEKGAAGPLIQAITAKGKACNHYVEHKEININGASDAKLIQSLESLLGHNAGMEAARSLGYATDKPDDKHTEH